MNENHYSITSDATHEIELLLERFETARNEGPVSLIDYVPDKEAESYASVVTELSRIDLEHRFNEGLVPIAQQYIDQFPEVYEDLHWRTQVAFEEYRLRRRRGDDISKNAVGERYSVDGSHWPELPVGTDSGFRLQGSVQTLEQRGLNQVPKDNFPRVQDTFAGYRIVSQLGEGAFSKVFLARQPDLAERYVVLKVTQSPNRESDRLASLQHSAIVPVFSIHRDGNLFGICMPYLGATTLADLTTCGNEWASKNGVAQELVSTILEKRYSTIRSIQELNHSTRDVSSETDAKRSWPEATEYGPNDELRRYLGLTYVDALVSLVTEAVDGLAYAHQRGIVHRDLKPANILVTNDGNPVLLDFNLAVSKLESRSRIVGGTLPYMSPQQLQSLESGAEADFSDDVFSMGVILYELLTGHLPFRSPTFEKEISLQFLAKERETAPPSIRKFNANVSPGLESIVFHCLVAKPSGRYQNAGELLEDLQAHQKNQKLKYAPERSTAERIQKLTRRHPVIYSTSTVATLAAILLLAALIMLWQRSGRIAKMSLEAKVAELDRELPLVTINLTSPGRESELLLNGLEQGNQLLDAWHARETNWDANVEVQGLSAEARLKLRRDLGLLAFQMADASFHVARQSSSELSGRMLERAKSLNQLATQLDYGLAPLAKLQFDMLSGDTEETRVRIALPDNWKEDMRLATTWASKSADAEQWIRLTERQLQRQPTNVSYWVNLAFAYSRLGNDAAAISRFDIANRLRPDSVAILLNRGIHQMKIGDLTRAVADFSACLSMNPGMMVPRFNRAAAYDRMGKLEEARQDLNRLIDDGNVRTRIYLMRAKVLDELGEIELAKVDRHLARSVPPRDANDWNSRGVSRLGNDPQGALDDFEAALRIDGSNAEASMNAAHVYSAILDQPENAIGTLTQLIHHRPNLASAITSRGILYARQGQTKLAMEDAHAATLIEIGAREELQIAGIFALTSQHLDREVNVDRAFSWLSKSLKSDIAIVLLARNDPDLEPLKNDRRFRPMIEISMLIHANSNRP
ncbi:protein kinase [Stieleria sp. JC731]|uniref:serine/threonine-protein kinase n=1 Tax=Pirellulaceae TaxID=2691357 RepID=UPI001E36E5EA|nr:serine/threonine-protein kinase [Stieleria sp. JC731]MCC9603396.1 protein kinase [Stieleria sp. JC731]